MALQDVRKEVNFCRKMKVPIIGVAENMSKFVCPKCQVATDIFPPSTGGAAPMCSELGLELLAQIPLDPRIGMCCDKGVSIFTEFPDSPSAKAFQQLSDKIAHLCETI